MPGVPALRRQRKGGKQFKAITATYRVWGKFRLVVHFSLGYVRHCLIKQIIITNK